ncbi:sulfite exporter TauE/SafE family protein [Longivirga aurantiaca]|uniref:Probable membrane transporter protein n=1 Tax=Longivirga aurantiaca TaxID=1837743 RepID=A0ABW1SYY6_9ACTN
MPLLLPVAAGLALGAVMGLLGGGGGVLAVPILLALGLSLDAAATTSLVVVGVGAAAGLATHARGGRVDWVIGLMFGALGSAGAIAGSRLAFAVDDRVQLAGFVVLLALAAYGMLRGRSESSPEDDDKPLPDPNWAVVVLLASGVGLVTGFFGVGGGFIAVPALVLALRMPMRRASATALVVILVNVTVAFLAHGTEHVDGGLTAVVAVGTAVGAVLGAVLQPRIPSAALQRTFGVLLLVVAAYQTAQLVLA